MSLIPIAKLAVHAVTTISVGKVVNDIIKNNTSVETAVDAVKVAAGSLVIGSIVGEAATAHVTDKMNRAVAWYEERQTEANPS
jgi:hypothetical protein